MVPTRFGIEISMSYYQNAFDILLLSIAVHLHSMVIKFVSTQLEQLATSTS